MRRFDLILAAAATLAALWAPAASHAEPKRLARPLPDPMENLADPQFLQRCRHEIKPAFRHATGQEDHICRQRPTQRAFQLAWFIRGMAECDVADAVQPEGRRQRVRIGAANLVKQGTLADGDEFVARAHDRDRGALGNAQVRLANGSRDGDRRAIEHCARRHQ